ncbi:fatty acid desaturase family protein [Yersinia similis]|uniref:fatty acid desaturase family protein n=1 Tax=Yersinia similis TaxID=367190 RepID=UPI0005E3899F|nr:acyl-CoA desaturase [Yersinia similis]CNB45521.1 Fatty acid desaturase [Yersinia similis]CNF06853.1 Fatty acid desaturase [Yersinia similis]
MPECLAPLHYPQTDEQPFHQQLQQAARDYLASQGEHHYADGGQWLKALVLLTLCVLFYALSLTVSQAWLFFLSYFLFVTMGMLLNVNVNHDASHNTFSRHPRLNRLIGRLVTLPLGVDPDYWRVRHVVYHHRYANVEQYDLDTEENGFFRQSPFQQWRHHMRYQHLYWPLIAALSLPWIAWVFDWSDRLDKTPLRQEKLLRGWQGWAMFILSKIGHLLLVLVIPLLVGQQNGIPWWVVILAYWLSQMFASLLVVFLLLGTHWADAEFFQAPSDHVMPHGWYHHNFATACDWVTSSRGLHHLTGGLNYHLTHHLFPHWHHRHYPALAEIIGTLAAKHGMNYRCISYRELMACQRQFLRGLGQEPKQVQG